MNVDMHIHTCYTDGSQTPEEVVACAKERDVGIISVCDHNSIEAYERLCEACYAHSVELIQGVELDCRWRGYSLHILAYNFDPLDRPLMDAIDKTRAELDHVSVHLLKQMTRDHPVIDLDEYAVYKKPPGRGGWLALNYLTDKGVARDLYDAMKFYDTYDPYTPDYYDIGALCRMITGAGGVPVLAHPVNWWDESTEGLFDVLTELKNSGVQGIECYYPRHSPAFTGMLAGFCRRNGMRVTCGGDGHGTFAQFVGGVERGIGVVKTDVSLLDLDGML